LDPGSLEVVGLIPEYKLMSKSFKRGRGGWVKKKAEPSFKRGRKLRRSWQQAKGTAVPTCPCP
jgi:hypothetical protein